MRIWATTARSAGSTSTPFSRRRTGSSRLTASRPPARRFMRRRTRDLAWRVRRSVREVCMNHELFASGWQRICADCLVGRPRTGHRNRGLEKNMKKTISAVAAVALLSTGVAFAQQATTTTQTGPTTTTNPATGATIERSSTTTEVPTSTGTKTTKKKHKKVTKNSGATKSTTTKTQAETASTPVPATK